MTVGKTHKLTQFEGLLTKTSIVHKAQSEEISVKSYVFAKIKHSVDMCVNNTCLQMHCYHLFELLVRKNWQEHTLHKWHILHTLCKMNSFVKITLFTELVANKINTWMLYPANKFTTHDVELVPARWNKELDCRYDTPCRPVGKKCCDYIYATLFQVCIKQTSVGRCVKKKSPSCEHKHLQNMPWRKDM